MKSEWMGIGPSAVSVGGLEMAGVLDGAGCGKRGGPGIVGNIQHY